MAIAIIGIGSNLGDRHQNIDSAIQALSKIGTLLSCATPIETEAVTLDNKFQPDFINTVIKLETMLAPEALLKELLKIETQLGRTRLKKWEARCIDLDILFYDDRIIDTKTLTIPHPEAHLRRFVLEPLCEIDPEFLHPLLKKRASELLMNLS